MTSADLNESARQIIASSLTDAAALYERLASDDSLPTRLRAQFAAQRRAAFYIACAMTAADTVRLSGQEFDPMEFRAPIWA